ncbi:acyl-CoA thioesterase [Mycolicibacter kumamotonensis]|uniref:Acyl-CoA thioesterase II n=1 Tax=Mycolicibacter kumamotonensis TaxID=354243 RepID=A0A7K3LBQ2_9MYCO|nr:acyl-CoA thioesterase domain-containing protein [Mycolicibacter kumamotonensis]NDJ89713.1 acyl-CoA thioesterase II [Mycolicibacter kumamotonensis]
MAYSSTLGNDSGHVGQGIGELFAVSRIGDERWRSCHVDPKGGRMYGGALAAQLLAAAGATVQQGVQVSNVDLRFVRPADGGQPVDYRVEDVYDGASSALRRVTAIQGGTTVAIGAAGFHTPREGWTHGVRQVPESPNTLPRTGTPHRSRAVTSDEFDIRFYDERDDQGLVRRLWFRSTNPPVGPTRYVDECALLYVSDLYFFEPMCLEHGLAGDDRWLRYATTQHSVWFHRPAKVDDWAVIESRSPALRGGRGLVVGDIYTAEGCPIATVVQEAVVWSVHN